MLTSQHKQQKVEVCTAVLSLLENDTEMFDNLLCSDKVHFHLDDEVNKQNCSYRN